MKIPISWLEEYVALGEKPAALALALTMRGIEVDHLDTRDPAVPVMDINIPSNRGDLLSVAGVAREIALLGLGRLRPIKAVHPPPAALKRGGLKVVVKAGRSCPLYTARVVGGVRVGPSPEWLVKRLEAAGLRSINNIVDATNYVMLAGGQPLHAFDADAIDAGTILVRQAADGERLKTLEGSELTLTPRDLIIADPAKPLALAGVIGGLSSGITQRTRSIVLESAWFVPGGIRHTRRSVGIATESSARFERSIDPLGVRSALDAVTALILSLAGGEQDGGIIQVGQARPLSPITLDRDDLFRLIGVEIPDQVLARILARIGIAKRGRQKKISLQVPSYRTDINLGEDLVEEVVRLWGIDKIPEIFPPLTAVAPPADPQLVAFGRLKDLMQDLGFLEVMSYDFASEKEIAHLAPSGIHPVEVQNPMSVQERFLRPTLLGGLLAAASRNQANQIGDLKLFEIGTVSRRDGTAVVESVRLGGLLVGNRDNVGLSPKPVPYDIFDGKGMMDTVLRHLNDDGAGCQVVPVDAKILGLYEVRGPAFYFELDLEPVARSGRSKPFSFTPLARFPFSFRDLAVIVGQEVPAANVVKELQACEKVLSAELFDCYEGAQVAAGHKSLAFHIRYGTNEGTLTDDQVERCHRQAVAILEGKFGARLR